MAVVFDSTFLVALLDPKVKGSGTSNVRLEYLVKTIDDAREKIIVPTPALSEVLIGAEDAAPVYLDILNKSRYFKIVPFGERAAVEAAAAHREAKAKGNKKDGSDTWAKLKFDRQIIAITKVEGATAIYSDDKDIARYAARDEVEVIKMADLPEPPKDPQESLPF